MRSIFSELVRQERLVVVEDLSVEAPKTKLFNAKLKDVINNLTLAVEQTTRNYTVQSINDPMMYISGITNAKFKDVRFAHMMDGSSRLFFSMGQSVRP